MSEKYRVHELVKFSYSDIGEYIDEDHTDIPLRNDILVELLNKQDESINELKYSNHNHAKTIIRLTDKINQLEKENTELKQDNDIKFWKLQCMRQHNSAQVILHELSLAIKQGYEVSDEFKEYTDDLEENNKKMIEKNKRLYGDSK